MTMRFPSFLKDDATSLRFTTLRSGPRVLLISGYKKDKRRLDLAACLATPAHDCEPRTTKTTAAKSQQRASLPGSTAEQN